jgi:hypothetical protein
MEAHHDIAFAFAGQAQALQEFVHGVQLDLSRIIYEKLKKREATPRKHYIIQLLRKTKLFNLLKLLNKLAEVHGNRTHPQASKALWDKGFSG